MGKTKGEFLFGEAASDKTRLRNQAPATSSACSRLREAGSTGAEHPRDPVSPPALPLPAEGPRACPLATGLHACPQEHKAVGEYTRPGTQSTPQGKADSKLQKGAIVVGENGTGIFG